MREVILGIINQEAIAGERGASYHEIHQAKGSIRQKIKLIWNSIDMFVRDKDIIVYFYKWFNSFLFFWKVKLGIIKQAAISEDANTGSIFKRE